MHQRLQVVQGEFRQVAALRVAGPHRQLRANAHAVRHRARLQKCTSVVCPSVRCACLQFEVGERGARLTRRALRRAARHMPVSRRVGRAQRERGREHATDVQHVFHSGKVFSGQCRHLVRVVRVMRVVRYGR
jgi:hypothetical protein